MLELSTEQKAACWDKFEGLTQNMVIEHPSGNSLMLEMLLREIKCKVILDGNKEQEE